MNTISNVKDRLIVSWRSKTGSEKKQIIKTIMVLGAVCVGLAMYYLNNGDEEETTKKAEPVEKRTVDKEKYLDLDIDARIEERVQIELAKALATQRLQASNVELPADNTENLDDLEFENEGDTYTPINDYPAQSYPTYNGNGMNDNSAPVQEPQPQFIGGITWEQASVSAKKQVSSDSLTKITIPVGFMPAMMIVGVQAPVSTSGKSNPKPIHLRVQAPATLPNKLKMNLAGCFVIANTWGNLASERIEGETATMNCMTQDKKTIISGQLHGYLADDDGQRDIAGRVVTKAGALLGRQFFADTLAGAGAAIAKNTGDVATSPLGTVTTLTGSEVAQQGLASGVGNGFEGAAEFISELISQSGPIIESGAARKVMIMVQKESVLEIKTVETYDQVASTN